MELISSDESTSVFTEVIPLVVEGSQTYKIQNNPTLNSQIGVHTFTLKVYLEEYPDSSIALNEQVFSVYVDKCMVLYWPKTF